MKPNWKDYLRSVGKLAVELGQVLIVFGILILAIFLITKYTVLVPLLCLFAGIVLFWDDLVREFKSNAQMFAEERHEKENPSDEA
ncbi:hypothetical protein EG103P2_00052 [Enterococcus phage EG103P2]|nr:hypothetical protein EG103P1_00027 [Enterococcus phage EG103P1]WAX15617.1 hypothetical protein EG103P2_00052 [Enterococcus phage EG103P2]